MKTMQVISRSGLILMLQLLVIGQLKALTSPIFSNCGGGTATVKGTNVNVRQSPDVGSKVITQLQEGEKLSVLERQEKSVTIAGKTDYWYKVTGKFGTGWVFGAFLEIQSTPESNLFVDQKIICEGLGNFYECHQKLEAEYLRYFPDFVKRSKGKLFLKMDDGKWKSYEDSPDPNSDEFTGFTLTGVFETPRAYFINEQHYEGGACILINRKNGSEFDVMGRPIFSDSKTKFACFSMDLEANYDPTGIEIWSWNNGKCTREFDLRDGTDGEDQVWGPTDLQWISENMIRVSRVTFGNEDSQYVPIDPLFYEFAKGKWQAVR